MVLRLSDLAGRWSGETVFVVGASAAWDGFDPRFFDDKRTIVINYVGSVLGLAETAITVSQYADMPDWLRQLGWGGVVVAPDRDVQRELSGGPTREADDRTIRFVPPPRLDFHPFLKHWTDEPEHLFVGTTSLHAALALAYRMGARTIVTVAADHGWWDGRTYVAGYPGSENSSSTADQLIRGHWPGHTDELAARLRSLGCDVYSLLPTVNLNLEGRTFEGPRARVGL